VQRQCRIALGALGGVDGLQATKLGPHLTHLLAHLLRFEFEVFAQPFHPARLVQHCRGITANERRMDQSSARRPLRTIALPQKSTRQIGAEELEQHAEARFELLDTAVALDERLLEALAFQRCAACGVLALQVGDATAALNHGLIADLRLAFVGLQCSDFACEPLGGIVELGEAAECVGKQALQLDVFGPKFGEGAIYGG